MSKIVAIDKTYHKTLRIDPVEVKLLGATEHLIPLVLSEFGRASTSFPIVFTKNLDTGQFSVVAMCGFEKQENLFFEQGSWTSYYVPLNILRQPFFLGTEDGKDGEKQIVCLDVGSPAISEEGEALFNKAGEPTPYLEKMQLMLSELYNGEKRTQKFVQWLAAKNLIQKMILDIKFDNGETLKVQGIYTIDEEALNQLPAGEFQDLRERGYLAFVYAMILSLDHISGMVKTRNIRNENAKGWFVRQPTN